MKCTVRFVKGDLEFLSIPVDAEIDDASESIYKCIANENVLEMQVNDSDKVILTPEVIAGGYFIIEKVEE